MAALDGRVVAITGGARGIGLATAKAFAAAGAKVAIGDLDADLATRVAADICGNVVARPLDVTVPESFSAFLDDAVRILGPLDVVVNNAGVMLTGEFVDESSAAEDKMIDINLRGVILGCKLAAERFIRRGGGTIVNVASMAGVGGFPGVATYCATKFGVVGLTYALREELRPHRIQVCAILPGVVHTELSAGDAASPGGGELRLRRARTHSRGGGRGRPKQSGYLVCPTPTSIRFAYRAFHPGTATPIPRQSDSDRAGLPRSRHRYPGCLSRPGRRRTALAAEALQNSTGQWRRDSQDVGVAGGHQCGAEVGQPCVEPDHDPGAARGRRRDE